MTIAYFYAQFTIRDMVDIASLIFIRIVAVVSVAEGFQKRHQQIDMLNKLTMIDAVFSNELKTKFRKGLERRETVGFFLKLLGVVLLNEFIIIIFVLNVGQLVLLQYWATYCVSWYLATASNIQTSFYVRSVLLRFKLLNERIELLSLKSSRQAISYSLVNSKEGTAINQLCAMRKLYHRLWEISNLINECFKWTLLVNIVNDFLSMVANFFWLFTWFADPIPEEALGIVPNIFLSVINVIHIVLIAHNCHFAVLEVSESCTQS